MRKFYFNLLFIPIISVLMLLTLGGSRTFAQEKSTQAADATSPTVTPSPTQTIVKYDLAYPGILPDNPLYKLKVLRDKISAVLISDPQKKIEFLLLQTDKGILSAAILVDKNEIPLAEETALKAENNYTLITQELYRLGKKPDQAFFDKLKKAAMKHQEVLNSLGMRVSEDKRKIFFAVADFSKRNWQTIEEYQKSY